MISQVHDVQEIHKRLLSYLVPTAFALREQTYEIAFFSSVGGEWVLVRWREIQGVALLVISNDDQFDRVLKSPLFAKAWKLRKLLELLFRNRHRYVSGAEISKELWNLPEDQHDGEGVRAKIYELRGKLEELENVGPSHFAVHNQIGEGYRLTTSKTKNLTGSAIFWRPHTKADDVLLVYTEPVFFFDAAARRYIRYLDTNPVSHSAALAELETKHSRDLKKLYGSQWAKNLVPRSIFLNSGEVGALDLLGEWFLTRSLLKVRREASARVSSVQEGCPILIGSDRTNQLIAALLNSEEARHFAYRPHPKFGFLSIKDAKNRELAALKKRFSVSQGAQRIVVAGNEPTLSIVRDRLAVLHRMPTPAGRGTITMISCDSAFAIRQVAFALTDDSQASQMMAQTGWTEESLPRSFEMLFGIRVSPANITHEAGLAELLACRSYP